MRWFGILALLLLLGGNCDRNGGVRPAEEVTVEVVIHGGGLVSGGSGDRTVGIGDTVTLVAEADTGFYFYGWDTGAIVSDNPLELQVTASRTIHAHFVKKPAHLVFIPSAGKQFTMGATAVSAAAVEKPAHPVELTYNFFMGAAEVTIAEYKLLMEELPAVAAGVEDDLLPVTGLTWYDAVRYCNKASKRDGYDTVYSYTAHCTTLGGCPYILENCVIHYNRFGYRLPTEAEWEYANRGQNTTTFFWDDNAADADEYAWFFDNGESRPHRGKLKKANGFGLYDIAGNVAEWVNDWLDFYVDSLYRNPVGPLHLTAEQFWTTGERPVKGGSYRLNSDYLRPSIRRGPYTVSAADVQKDIGFRVVLGAFEAPASAPSVITADSLDARVVVNKSDLLALSGTHKMKAAFVFLSNFNHYCVYTDFSTSPVVLQQCSDDSSVIAPVFSPDGAYIAWGSKDEGSWGNSTISIRSLHDDFPLTDSFPGFLPRFWVDPQNSDTFLVYTDGAMHNNLPEWSTEKTYRCRISAGVRAGSPEVLWSRGSYHGGLSSDGRFLGTAFPDAKLVDLQLSDTNIFYFKTPWNGLTFSPQVCNLSMSPSKANPGEALFLDFGSPEPSSLVGRSYNFHEIIFEATTELFSKDHVARWFVVPDSFGQWNYSEYTNHPNMITAVAQGLTGSCDDAVFLINAMDSSFLSVITGRGLRDPAIWIDPNEVAEEEDLFRHFGKYHVPIQMEGHVVLAKKLRLFWHERENAECVAIGNSPMLYGFDPRHITTLSTLSVAWFASSIGGSITVAQEYILPHTPGLKVLIIDLDASYFTVDTRLVPRLTGLGSSIGYELDSSYSFYRNGVPEAVTQKIGAFTSDNWNGFDLQGAFTDSMIGNGWGSAVVEGGDYSLEDSIVKQNIALFKTLLDSTAAHNVTLLAINFPQNPGYASTGMVGRFGPTNATYQQLAELMESFTQEYSNFYFYDANNGGNHDYSSAEALDDNHLNARGGARLADRVDSLLQIIVE